MMKLEKILHSKENIACCVHVELSLTTQDIDS